jgi:uncharacterized protein YydD (DUF2326 family)
MIRSVTANKPSFKTVQFGPGMNVVWADRTRESSKKDSRNGLGKSTLIEIIHFCLGSTPKKGKGLMVEALADWEFTLELDVAGKPVQATRATGKPRRMTVEGDTAGLPRSGRASGGERYVDVNDWTDWLGQRLFGLSSAEQLPKYQPTFRSLISYFVRRNKDAFSTPFEHHRKQSEWDRQVNNAYLLKLNWEDASAFQALKDRRKGLTELKQAAKQGVVKDFMGTLGDLEARRVRLAAKVEEEADSLRSFRVHPNYVDMREQANRLTAEIHEAVNANTIAQRLMDLYRTSQTEETPPAADAVARLYADAGVNLPGVTLRALDEVQQFHETVIHNRRAFLDEEAQRLARDVQQREQVIGEKTEQRAGIMEIIQTHGALEEYTLLQRRHMDTVAELNAVENLITNVTACQNGLSQVKIDQELLLQKARRDLDERAPLRDRAIAQFNDYSECLYEAPGRLVINPSPTGFKFDVEIDRSGSDGIGNMKIFCYDLMLARLWSGCSTSPGFLIHDSTIFDGVDERQRALAIELAASESQGHGFQYICTLNTDYVPRNEFSSGFRIEDHIRLRLTDADVSGCLMGVRF